MSDSIPRGEAARRARGTRGDGYRPTSVRVPRSEGEGQGRSEDKNGKAAGRVLPSEKSYPRPRLTTFGDTWRVFREAISIPRTILAEARRRCNVSLFLEKLKFNRRCGSYGGRWIFNAATRRNCFVGFFLLFRSVEAEQFFFIINRRDGENIFCSPQRVW